MGEYKDKNSGSLPLEVKWKVIDHTRFKKEKLEILQVEDGVNILAIDLAYIPIGMSLKDYIEYIQKEGIVVKDSYGK